jgi:hypothetical protein
MIIDSTAARFRQVTATISGPISLRQMCGYENLMRVAGRIMLIRLSRGALGDLAAGLRALLAELEEAQWKSEEEALEAYPSAEVDAHRLVISLDERHCAVVALNYQSEIALIEYAGLKSSRLRTPLRSGARL